MIRLVSAILIYPASSVFESDIMPILEQQFTMGMQGGEHIRIGEVRTYIFDLHVSRDFAPNKAERQIHELLPGVRIRLIERFRDTWWDSYKWPIVFTVVGGISVGLIVDYVRSFVMKITDMLR